MVLNVSRLETQLSPEIFLQYRSCLWDGDLLLLAFFMLYYKLSEEVACFQAWHLPHALNS